MPIADKESQMPLKQQYAKNTVKQPAERKAAAGKPPKRAKPPAKKGR